MSLTRRVNGIFVASKAGEALTERTSAVLKAGQGIVGDRYYSELGTFSDKAKNAAALEVTLIEQEKIDAFNVTTGLNYAPERFRRNIITQNIDLNALVDKEFYIGTVKLRGIMLCEPCAYLAELLGSEIMEHMIHKAGLRAQILISGEISKSDIIKLET